MNKVVAAVTFLAVSGGMYVLCANAHIDVFPCEIAEVKHIPVDMLGTVRTQVDKHDGTCSVLANDRGTDPDGGYERLTPAGWAVVATFCGGIGAIAGLGLGALTRNKA